MWEGGRRVRLQSFFKTMNKTVFCRSAIYIEETLCHKMRMKLVLLPVRKRLTHGIPRS